MTDLTAITTPFCLMDDETKDALKAYIGALQTLNFSGVWEDIPSGLYWQENSTYRVKPAPPKPREWWLCGRNFFPTKLDAQEWSATMHPDHTKIIRVIEVLP